MSPTSLPAPGTSWMIAGSSVPPPPTQIHQQGEVRWVLTRVLNMCSVFSSHYERQRAIAVYEF